MNKFTHPFITIVFSLCILLSCA